MTVSGHRHDFAATNTGYKCTGCDAVVSNAEIVASTAGTPDPGHVWKKLHL